MKSALDNIRVLDLTRVLAGPYATMLLADLGADVIKVEMPGTGDDSRHFGPFVNNESAYFMAINRNKRSMTLNLKNERGKEIFLSLVKKSDVLVENFRPGTMEKLGLGYDKLIGLNPRLIYAAASGYGHTGPYSQRAAYDAVVQAMGGIMSITGEKDGKPMRVGTSIGDIAAVGDVKDEMYDKVFDVNVKSVVYSMRKAVKYFEEVGGGNIINIASIGGLYGGVAGAVYTASKHAVVGLTKNTAFMYALKNIRCNAICPGAIATEIASSEFMKTINMDGAKRTGIGLALNPRTGQGSEIAQVAVFLASDEASFVNGQCIAVDGGWRAY